MTSSSPTEPDASERACIAASWLVQVCAPRMLDDEPAASALLRSLDPIDSRRSAERADCEVSGLAHTLRRDGEEREWLWPVASAAALAATTFQEGAERLASQCAEEVESIAADVAREALALGIHEPITTLVAEGAPAWMVLSAAPALGLA